MAQYERNMTTTLLPDYWDCMSAHFDQLQSPLRPCAQDLRIYREILGHDVNGHGGGRRVLLFGVTPELAQLDWPDHTELTAIDRSLPMIRRVWPGEIPGRRAAIRGNWFDARFQDGTFDFALGDGILTGVPYPEGYGAFAERVVRWLKPEGILILRNFSAPSPVEPLEKVIDDLGRGGIACFDVFKWRLAMALHENSRTGVVVDDVYRAWTRIVKEDALAAAMSRWPRAAVDTIHLYAGRKNRYAFPTTDEVDAAFAPHLRRKSVTIPAYDLGERCPIVVYRAAERSE